MLDTIQPTGPAGAHALVERSSDAGLEPLAPQARLPAPREDTTLGLIELLLKNPTRVYELNRDAQRQGELFPRFLFIAMLGYLIFSSTMLLVLTFVPAPDFPRSLMLSMPPARWSDGTAISLPVAFTTSIVLAACVCLPTLYFFALLAGTNLTWLQIVSLIGKGMAANAILLLGILPIYVAIALGMIIFGSPSEALQWTVVVGLALPLVSGMWGLHAVYSGLLRLVTELPACWQQRRHCFLRRLILSWAAVYAAVLPIMIYRTWEFLALRIQAL